MADDTLQNFNILTFNLHGFNQGFTTVSHFCFTRDYHAVFVQEHWLYPHNIHKILSLSDNYTGFGISAMIDKLDAGVFYGRPYGGVAILLHNDCVKFVTKVVCSDRYVIVCLGDIALINLYLPCLSNLKKDDHSDMLIDIFDQLIVHMNELNIKQIILGGDLNTDLRRNTPVTKIIVDFANLFTLVECSSVHTPMSADYTYIHSGLDHRTWIDWFLVSSSLCNSIVKLDIIEWPLNLSDHLPVSLELKLSVGFQKPDDRKLNNNRSPTHEKAEMG